MYTIYASNWKNEIREVAKASTFASACEIVTREIKYNSNQETWIEDENGKVYIDPKTN